jgi:hypothetical protein
LEKIVCNAPAAALPTSRWPPPRTSRPDVTTWHHDRQHWLHPYSVTPDVTWEKRSVSTCKPGMACHAIPKRLAAPTRSGQPRHPVPAGRATPRWLGKISCSAAGVLSPPPQYINRMYSCLSLSLSLSAVLPLDTRQYTSYSRIRHIVLFSVRNPTLHVRCRFLIFDYQGT